MQGKGIIKFFLVVLTLVCILQYSFMLPTIGVEKRADEFAKSLASDINDPIEKKQTEKDARAAYLDSMSSEVVFSIPLIKSWTYEELKASQLAYGLDLKGGMSVVLQVDLREFIRALANDSKDPTFNQALENASKAQASAQSDFVTLFADEYQKLAPDGKLYKLFYRTATFKDKIDSGTSNGEIIGLIREAANETVGLTHSRLKDRIDELGVIQPNVSLDAARDLITVELPGISNPERARNFLQTTAKLEFWKVYRVSDPGIISGFVEADTKLKKQLAGTDTAEEEDTNIRIDTAFNYNYDSLGNVVDSTMMIDTVDLSEFSDPLASGGPLLQLLQLNATTGGQVSMPLPIIGLAEKNKIPQINKYLEQPGIKALFPKDVKFLWSYDPASDYGDEEVTDRNKKLYELYAIQRSKGSEKAPLEGDVVTRATANPDQNGEIAVSLMMNGTGAKKWGKMTTEAAQDQNREIAIVLDNKVKSAPRVINPILTGSSSITGSFSMQEAQDLAKILEIGKLPAETKIIQESLVGPSLGAENISRSIQSLMIGFSLLLLFMILYYGKGGVVSILALLLNLFFIGGALASFGTVLTLPGIAGIVLTIGMAVDANVIIYERIREELREGKTILASIKDGFQHSYSAIIDANVTTILTAMVLAYFGLGPIKGFAVILIIGVVSSLFTAVLVGRLMIDTWTSGDRTMSFWTNTTKNMFANLNVDWLSKRKIAYGFSLTIIALGIGSFIMRGFELGVDFKGGYSYNIQFDQGQTIDEDQLRSTLDNLFESNTTVKAVSTENTYNVTTSYLINDDSDTASDQVMAKLFEGVNSIAGGNVNFDQFKDPDGSGTYVTSSSKVGPNIADDIKVSSIYATVFALLLIFLYIFIRFNKWQYSMGAVAALFHDTLVVLAIFSLGHGILPFSMEIDQAFIGAILTVIGYSINDTVVLFDRIREYLNTYTGKTKHEIINAAVNSTLSRTVITSLTTLFVVSILLFFGGTSTRGFAFALFIGIIVGTYSSVFVATPIMSDLTGELKPKNTKKRSFSRAAS